MLHIEAVAAVAHHTTQPTQCTPFHPTDPSERIELDFFFSIALSFLHTCIECTSNWQSMDEWIHMRRRRLMDDWLGRSTGRHRAEQSRGQWEMGDGGQEIRGEEQNNKKNLTNERVCRRKKSQIEKHLKTYDWCDWNCVLLPSRGMGAGAHKARCGKWEPLHCTLASVDGEWLKSLTFFFFHSNPIYICHIT